MPSHDRLLQLFQAFRERNDASFRRAAEAIIADELAANRHGPARELQQAIGSTNNDTNVLRALPKVMKSDDLLFFPKPPTDPSHLLLVSETEHRLGRVIDEYNNRLKLAAHGYRPKNRLLFWGPPGCGKTLAAHHLAQQLSLPLGVLRISAAVSSYLGETATRVQHAFDLASRSPMILFLDEVDAIAKDRDDDNDVGELKRVVNCLLQALDTFPEGRSVLVSASNHQYLIDSAVWRRFDAVIQFPLPTAEARETFIKRFLNGVRISGSLAPAAKAAEYLSFAEIEQAVTEAIKSMILADRDELKGSEITDEVKSLKTVLVQARQRPPRPPRDSS